MNIERIKAIATIIVTAGVNIANICGYAMDAEPIVSGVLSVISFAAIIYSWWFNQNVTAEAQEAQKVLRMLKTEKKAKASNGE